MMYALIDDSAVRLRVDAFPTSLQRNERVLAVSTLSEIDRLLSLMRARPVTGETYLYLMLDRRTELTKIGTSRNPRFRERTLQSDAPDVNLFYSRLASLDHERQLHRDFATLRQRGEWFALSRSHWQQIRAFMDQQHRDQDLYEMRHREMQQLNPAWRDIPAPLLPDVTLDLIDQTLTYADIDDSNVIF